MNKKQKAFRVQEADWQEFKNLAKQNNTTPSNLIREYIKLYNSKYKKISVVSNQTKFNNSNIELIFEDNIETNFKAMKEVMKVG